MVCKGRVRKAGQNRADADGPGQFLSEPVGNSENGSLRRGVDDLIGNGLASGRRSRMDEVTRALLAKDRQGGGNSEQDAFDVDVHHVALPMPLLAPVIAMTAFSTMETSESEDAVFTRFDSNFNAESVA